jgi:capsular exopolysaccharide synthesis family protein
LNRHLPSEPGPTVTWAFPMRQPDTRGGSAGPQGEPPRASVSDIGLGDVIAFFRRRRMTVVLTVVATMLLGAIYIFLTPPAYTATAALLIDTRRLAIFTQGDVVADTVVNNAAVETQVEILLSSRIAEAVAAKLNLVDDPEFQPLPPSLISTVIGHIAAFFAKPAPAPSSGAAAVAANSAPLLDPAAARIRTAANILRSNLVVQRAGLSLVMDLSYTSSDPYKAGRIANAFADAFIDDQLNSQVSAAQRASNWLQSRIQSLRDQATQEGLTAQEKSAVRATYDSFLQRYTQAVQQQSLPSTEARVITSAAIGTKTAPRSFLIFVASILFGGMAGLGIALARDLLDKAVRTRHQVEAATGTPFLGYLPVFDHRARALKRMAKRSAKLLDVNAHTFAAPPGYAVALTAPFSRFTETLRNIKVAARLPGERGHVLGVISSVANEGKTTVAANLARLVAQGGSHVLLVDGDLRNSSLSRDLVPDGSPGLVQLARGEAELAALRWSDQASRFDFLPAGSGPKLVNPGEILAAPGMPAVIEALRLQYDLVVIDLPAVLPVVDARAVAHLFDTFVLVVEWGLVSEDILAQASHIPEFRDKVVGTVLNKVDLAALRRFETSSADFDGGNYVKAYRHTA